MIKEKGKIENHFNKINLAPPIFNLADATRLQRVVGLSLGQGQEAGEIQ